MKIKIKGSCDRVTRDELIRIIKFYTMRLTPRLFDKVSFTLECVPGLLKNSESYGELRIIDEDSQLPRQFHIAIDDEMSKARILEILAHEMVHMEQYASGRMRDLNVVRHTVYWKHERKGKGCRYESDGYDFFQPWEVEARGLASVLKDEYEAFNNIYERM